MTTWNERVSLAKYAPNSVLMQQETGNAEGSSTDEWNLNSSHAGNLKSKPDKTASPPPPARQYNLPKSPNTAAPFTERSLCEWSLQKRGPPWRQRSKEEGRTAHGEEEAAEARPAGASAATPGSEGDSAVRTHGDRVCGRTGRGRRSRCCRSRSCGGRRCYPDGIEGGGDRVPTNSALHARAEHACGRTGGCRESCCRRPTCGGMRCYPNGIEGGGD